MQESELRDDLASLNDLVSFPKEKFLVKIAVESKPAVKRPTAHLLAADKGWTVSAMTCEAGPKDRSFEEQHSDFAIALVTGGSFQYRSQSGRELMAPGCVLLGNPGQHFQCGHEHSTGDRCISFAFKPDYFDNMVHDCGVRDGRFRALRLPPMRELSSLFARACALNAGCGTSEQWEETAIELAGRALELGTDVPAQSSLPSAEARVTRVIRMLEESRSDANYTLSSLAREARLSQYHFLRVFQQLTGLTPHKYILRARLRRVATRLMVDRSRVLDIALDCGFGDISNFNHAFRAEFGTNPRAYAKRFFSGNHS